MGIEDVMSDILPKDKVNIITDRQGRGEVVGFVSNGIDDEEALKTSDVGFAMGSQAYKAKNADITMLGESLYSLLDAIRVSKATLRNIKQNLTGAFVYNSLGIPLAAGVFYPLVHALLSPILAGALMASSSLGVVLNANRLRFVKATDRKKS